MLCATNFTGTSTCNRSSSLPILIEADDDDDTNFKARVDETSLRRCASDTQQPDDDDAAAFRRRDRAAAAHNRDMMVALLCNLEREEKARSKMTLFCMGSSKAICRGKNGSCFVGAKKTTFCEEEGILVVCE